MGARDRFGLALLLAVAFVFSLVSLVSGADYLLWFVGPFPTGNLLSVIGLVALPALAWLYAGQCRWLRRLCVSALSLAVLWYPVSMLIAGNTTLNFSGDRGFSWLILTALSVLLSLLTPLVVAISRAVERVRSGRSD